MGFKVRIKSNKSLLPLQVSRLHCRRLCCVFEASRMVWKYALVPHCMGGEEEYKVLCCTGITMTAFFIRSDVL